MGIGDITLMGGENARCLDRIVRVSLKGKREDGDLTGLRSKELLASQIRNRVNEKWG